jgi:hypothetical protein
VGLMMVRCDGWGLPRVIGEEILDGGGGGQRDTHHPYNTPAGELAFKPHSSSSLSFIWCYHHHRRHASIIQTATRQIGRSRPRPHGLIKSRFSLSKGFHSSHSAVKSCILPGGLFLYVLYFFCQSSRI